MTSTVIRGALIGDVGAISHLIIQTLREINAKDYPTTVIEEVIKSFSPDQIVIRMKQRHVFVVIREECIIGTASLEDNVVRPVFILPNNQHQHIGSMLMSHLEKIAKELNIHILTVPSSITAKGFYRKLGYKVLRNEHYGEERTIIMEKHLTASVAIINKCTLK